MKRLLAAAVAATFLLTGCTFNPGSLFQQQNNDPIVKVKKDKVDKQDLTPEQRQDLREQKQSKGKGK